MKYTVWRDFKRSLHGMKEVGYFQMRLAPRIKASSESSRKFWKVLKREYYPWITEGRRDFGLIVLGEKIMRKPLVVNSRLSADTFPFVDVLKIFSLWILRHHETVVLKPGRKSFFLSKWFFKRNIVKYLKVFIASFTGWLQSPQQKFQFLHVFFWKVDLYVGLFAN